MQTRLPDHEVLEAARRADPTVVADAERPRREELGYLRARLASAEQAVQQTADQQKALREASAEIEALRTSMSWRITGPLRNVYGQWLRWRGTE